MIFAIILAGGVGSRMQTTANMPKQFLPLGNKPIVMQTLDKILTCDRFDAVYVGTHPDWVGHMNDLIEQNITSDLPVKVVAGGADRNSTLFNVIAKIEEEYGESEEHIIVTTDAVRPFITLRMIEENIDAACKYGAVDTVVKATDTIVRSLDGESIESIPDRSTLYQGQTPQSFNLSLLKRLYGELSEEEKAILTDACKICALRGVKVHLVEGSDKNIKITTPGDYKIAQAMLGGSAE